MKTNTLKLIVLSLSSVGLLAGCQPRPDHVPSAESAFVRSAASETGTVTLDGDRIEFVRTAPGKGASRFSVSWEFPGWEDDTYLFMPACAYNGNRDIHRRTFLRYPPYCCPENIGLNPRLDGAQVPGLEPDGSGLMEVTAGDMSVPCFGVYLPKARKGVLVYTEQEVRGLNLGFTVTAGVVRVDYPANRHWAYRMCKRPAEWYDKPMELESGEKVTSRLHTIEFAAAGIPEFLEKFFRNRKCLLRSERPANGFTEALWQNQERFWNDPTECWDGFCYHQEPKKYTPGWTGGLSSVLPLYLKGNEETRRRAVQTVDFQVRHQAPSGFYYGCVRVRKDENTVDEPGCGPRGYDRKHFVRRSTDALMFLCRCARAMGWRESWRESARKCADAFLRNWQRYGQLGQWVDHDTGDIIVGRSTSAAMAGAALVEAYRDLGERKYLEAAVEITEDYCRRDLDRGVTYGGPGDILMAADSESAFALLESCVLLAEETKSAHWIARSRQAAALASTWVVAYAYRFPADCGLAKLGVNSLGSVFASVQNKHAAPGICTVSGDSLLKLYRLTGDREYLELCKDIAYFLPQMVPSPEHPMRAVNGKQLKNGLVCERVNLSDWENHGRSQRIGHVGNFSCWCGTSVTLSFVELLNQPEFVEDR